MKKSNEKPEKKDQRKIPEFFRAVEKEENPTVYYGFLLNDDGFFVSCFAAHDAKESTHFKERTFKKNEYRFSKIDRYQFEEKSRFGLFNMGKELADKKLEHEAIDHSYRFAVKKLEEIIGDTV